jgi:hypothetical protein
MDRAMIAGQKLPKGYKASWRFAGDLPAGK